MQIFKTLEELRQATIGYTVVNLNMEKKKSSAEIHAGHEHILNYGRQFGNKTVVGFWQFLATASLLFPELIINKLSEWDRDGCIAWAESQNVDIVFAPDYEDELAIYQIGNIEYYKQLLNRLWKNENYDSDLSSLIGTHDSNRAKAHCLGRLSNGLNYKYLFSWKDGIMRFVEAHFAAKYTDSRCILADPLKSPEGIYYSSNYNKYTTLEKQTLAQIEPTVAMFDTTKDIGVLKDNIDVFGKDIGLRLDRITINTNAKLLGPNHKLCTVIFSLGEGDDIKKDIFTYYMNT